MSALKHYIGETAAQNLQAQLPNNRVQVVVNEFNEGSNKINIKLKVHGTDDKKGRNSPAPDFVQS